METTSNIPSDAELSIEETITDLEEAMEAEVAAVIAATQEHAATSHELSPPLSIDPADVASAGFEPTLRAALEKAGAGILLTKHARPKRIRAAIETVLGDAAYRTAAERLGADIRRRDGAEVAADAIVEYVNASQLVDS